MMDPEIPKNEGFFEQIKLVVPKGCVLNPTPGKPVSAGTHHPGADVGEVIAVAMQHVLPDAAVPQTYKTGIPTIIVGVDPAHGRVVHRPLGRGVRRLVQRGEGHGRVGRAQRAASATSGRRPPRSTSRCTRTSSGAATTAPTPAGPGQWRGICGSHYEKEVRVDAKVYTYVVGMKYPMPGICGGKQRRAERDDHPLRQRRPVPRRAHRRLGADRRPASASCTTTAAAAVGAIRSTAIRRPCSTTCSTSTCRSRARAATTASCSPARSKTSRSRSTRPRPSSSAPRCAAATRLSMGYRVGVDVGGTFTDLICVTPDGRDRARQDADDARRPVDRRDERPRRSSPSASASRSPTFCARARHPRARHDHRRQHDDRDERRGDRAARHRGPPRRDRAAPLPQGGDLGPELPGPDPDRAPPGAHPDPRAHATSRARSLLAARRGRRARAACSG